MSTTFLGVALAVLPFDAAGSDLYTWTDRAGVLHFTDEAKTRASRRYQGPDSEGFGGQPPMVITVAGRDRVLYPVKVTRFDPIFKAAASHYRLPFSFLKAVAKVESNFNPRAVSKKNAKGLMQMIDSTARAMKVKDPFDPEQSIYGGARYLRLLANQFEGDMTLTAAAYNAGPKRVQRLKRVPSIRETQKYVRRVIQMADHYRRAN